MSSEESYLQEMEISYGLVRCRSLKEMMIGRAAQFRVVGSVVVRPNFGFCFRPHGEKKVTFKRGKGWGAIAFDPFAVVRAPRTWGVYKPLHRGHWLLRKKVGAEGCSYLCSYCGCESAQNVGCL